MVVAAGAIYDAPRALPLFLKPGPMQPKNDAFCATGSPVIVAPPVDEPLLLSKISKENVTNPLKFS